MNSLAYEHKPTRPFRLLVAPAILFEFFLLALLGLVDLRLKFLESQPYLLAEALSKQPSIRLETHPLPSLNQRISASFSPSSDDSQSLFQAMPLQFLLPAA